MAAPSTEELLEQFKDLNYRREQLLIKRAGIQAKIDHAKNEKAKLEQQMEELGTSPATIADDELLARQELLRIVTEYGNSLNALELQLKEAEKLFHE